jgi:hypothetical protein
MESITMSKPSTEVARPHQTLMADLADMALLDGGSSFDIASKVVDDIATSTTVDDVFAANESGPLSLKEAKDYHNIPLAIVDVAFRKSDTKYLENSLGVYVVIDAVNTATGEPLTFSCGAPNVVASMRKLQLLGAINADAGKAVVVKFKAKPTQNGELLTVHKG